MLSRRELLRGIGVTAGSVLLASCSQAPSAGTPAQPATAAQPTLPPVPVPTARSTNVAPATGAPATYKLDLGGYKGPAPTAQTITLRVTHQDFFPAAEQWWKDRYAEWTEAYPNITFNEEIVPYGDLQSKLQTYVSSGDTPDIIMGKGDFTRSYAFNEVAANLSEFLADDFIADIAPAVKQLQMVDGKLYCWPWDQGNVLFWFNKDLFAQAGVPAPPETTDVSQAWTWDQALDAWKKLSAALNGSGDPTIYAIGAEQYGNGGPGSSYWFDSVFIRGLGDPNAPKDSTPYKTFAAVSDDGLKVSGYVDTPEAIKGMQFYQSLYQQKLIPPVPVSNQFQDGKAATHFEVSSLGQRMNAAGVRFRWGASPIPKGNILFAHTSGDAPIVLQKSKYIAEAVAFLSFITNEKNELSWRRVWGSPPARVSFYDKIGYKDPWDLLGLAMLKVGYPTPLTPGYLEYFNAMNTAVKDIALGANVADRLHTVAGQVDDLLANYKR